MDSLDGMRLDFHEPRARPIWTRRRGLDDRRRRRSTVVVGQGRSENYAGANAETGFPASVETEAQQSAGSVEFTFFDDPAGFLYRISRIPVAGVCRREFRQCFRHRYGPGAPGMADPPAVLYIGAEWIARVPRRYDGQCDPGYHRRVSDAGSSRRRAKRTGPECDWDAR